MGSNDALPYVEAIDRQAGERFALMTAEMEAEREAARAAMEDRLAKMCWLPVLVELV